MDCQPPRLLVLISGSGTNLQALIDATTSTPPTLNATITHVISNKKAAYGLTRASAAGIPTTYHNLLSYKKSHPSNQQEARQAYDADLARLILKEAPDLVVCAGWMHILSPTCLDPLVEARIDMINLHPALPKMFDGAGAIERAFEAWEKGEIQKTGVMVHHVIHTVDRGEPIVVREVELRKGDTLADLEERIHAIEHVEILNATGIALEQRRRKMAKS
ncbi:Bifunctional purine biosynthetic protein ADE5,7 [Maublancomyces gigas]|uniref:phosphoribosylglycinamide formyltransferase 1 n=1 Tax=Discina gigas TaxID=1032678 RepID=A0ABR3GM37_9PEZI